MNRNNSILPFTGRLYLVLLVVLFCSACGGSGSESSPTDGAPDESENPSGNPDGEAISLEIPVLYVPDNAQESTILFGEDQQALAYQFDQERNAYTGFTLFNGSGFSTSVELDPETGLPLYMVSDNHLFAIRNIDLSLGTADMEIFAPDGTSELFEGVDFLGHANSLNVTLDLEPDATVLQGQSLLDRAHSGKATLQQVVADREKVAGAFGLAFGIVSCTGSAILTAGAAASIAVDPVKVVGLYAFETTLGATALTCGPVAATILATKFPNSAVANAINDLVSLVTAIPDVFTGCPVPGGGTESGSCFENIVKLAELVKTNTVNRLLGAYLRFRQGTATLSELSVYCCTGPRALKLDQFGASGRWRASVVDGIGTPPYTYQFNWGDGEFSQLVDSNFSRTEQHNYRGAGIYTLSVDIIDQAGNSDTSTTPVANQPTPPPFTVFVVDSVDELALSITGDSMLVFDQAQEWTFAVEGGLGPFQVDVDWGDGERANLYITPDTRSPIIKHRYQESSNTESGVTISATVTDLDLDGIQTTDQLFVGTGGNYRVLSLLDRDLVFTRNPTTEDIQNAGLILSGDLSQPTISWSWTDITFVSISDSVIANRPFGLIGLENPDSEIAEDRFPISPPVVYGDYNRSDALPTDDARMPPPLLTDPSEVYRLMVGNSIGQTITVDYIYEE